MPRSPHFTALLVLSGLTGIAAPAAAELVVLDNGRFFKVSEYRLAGEQVHLTLISGGRLVMPLGRIERVVDDEVVPEPPQDQEMLTAGAGIPVGFTEGQAEPATPYGREILAVARRHAINPDLVAAVIRAESAFDPEAISVKGARGLMQLMPATARRFGVEEFEIFDPERNLEAGVGYLAWLLKRFDEDLPRVLAAYNAGEGTVDRYGGIPPYRETRNYIRRVYRALGLSVTGLSL